MSAAEITLLLGLYFIGVSTSIPHTGGRSTDIFKLLFGCLLIVGSILLGLRI